MVRSCVAFNCQNKDQDPGLFKKQTQEEIKNLRKISFFSFPLQDKERCKLWVEALKYQGWVPTKLSKICSDHFREDSFYELTKKRSLKEDAVPSIFNFPTYLLKPECLIQSPKMGLVLHSGLDEEVQNTVEEIIDLHQSPLPNIHECLIQSPKLGLILHSGVDEEIHNISEEIIDLQPSPLPYKQDSKRSILHDHNYEDTPRTQLKKKKTLIEKYKKQTDALRQNKYNKGKQVTRLRKKIKSLESVVKLLKKKEYISSDFIDIIEGNFKPVMTKLLKRSVMEKSKTFPYDKEIKQFAATLHFLSPKAYLFLSKYLTLPHESTLQKWASGLTCKPGPLMESFAYIKSKAESSCEKLLFNLTFDEMSIRKMAEFDGNQFIGGCDLGFGSFSDCNSDSELATECLFFLAVQVNGNVKVPLGYALIKGITSIDKANLLLRYITLLHETGARCLSVTCDGAYTNLSLIKQLGGCLEVGETFKEFFNFDNSKVYFFLDPPHMLKLIRNLLGSLKVIKNGNNGKVIQWAYIERLYELQSKEGLHLGNKLRKAHIEWEKQKMKVRLAAQTFSSSVADSLSYCLKANLHGFQDCEETIEFIRHIDMLFDLLNCRSPYGKGSKSPLMMGNKDYWSTSFTKAKQYLMSLETTDGQKLYEGRRKVGIIGFLLDIESTWSLAEDLLWCDDCQIRYLLLHKFSQDHLETLFSVIRSRLEYNNNPSALQLQRALRSILIGRINYYSEGGNCQKSEEYLPDLSFRQCDFANPEESCESYDINMDNDVAIMPILSISNLSNYVTNVVEYISGYVCRQLFHSLDCSYCAATLQCNANRTTNDHFITIINRGGLFVPSKDVVTVCSWAEKIIRQEQLNIKPKFSLHIIDRLMSLTIRHINMTVIFSSLSAHVLENSVEDNHIVKLVKIIIRSYLKIRLHYISKSFNENAKGVSIRSKLNKIILFKGH